MALPLLEVLHIIETQYPEALAILQKPGVFQVYSDYVNSQKSQDGMEPWTDAQFNAKLRATDYYQWTPEGARTYDVLAATDPASAREKSDQVRRTVEDLERELGIKLSDTGGLTSPKLAFMVDAVRFGWDANEIRYRMIGSVNKTAGGGLLASTAAHIKSMANDYGVPLSDGAVMNWATKQIQGAMDDAGVKGYLIEQAKSLFPGLTAALDQGITVRQYADPYVQLAQQELDLNPADVNLTDQKWMTILNKVDPKTGGRVSMSLDEALAAFRSDTRFGYDTSGTARQSATQLASALQQRMGTAA